MEKLKSSLIYASYLEQLSSMKALGRMHQLGTAFENNIHCFQHIASLPDDSDDWMEGAQEVLNILIMADRVKKLFGIVE